jgi:hypothetical protein
MCLKKIGKAKSGDDKDANIATDEVIHPDIPEEMVSIDKDFRDSVSRSNADLLPKLHNEMPNSSMRSSHDKEFTKDDSGEIVEYQGKSLLALKHSLTVPYRI